MKQCDECKESIKINATRCHHCTVLQGWRRLIKIPLIMLTVILTVASIFSSEVIKKITDPKTAIIQSVIIDGSNREVAFMVTNEGSRAATLSNVKIEGQTTEGYSASYLMKSDLDGKLLEPSHTYRGLATGYIIPKPVEHQRSIPLKEIYGFADNCRLLIEYVDINGQHIIRPYPFMCDPISANPKGGLSLGPQ
ncbi:MULTISPECIES: hypothetical protein [Pseudomonas]|jgi:hypothetical protein|uniref:hypothetical protein n=1 Tax=Pseudomonas TaxID=286 RepID=UPI002093E9C6|nr:MULTISPECIES: hypothetical protein [Pseudomonas]UST71407.1 hypothetical protein NF674_10850 [Pseudomonas moraviensis]